LVRALRPIQAAAACLLALLVIGGPVALLVLRTHAAFLLLLALMYLTIIFMLIMVYVRKQKLGLTGREFGRLAFDSLACAPLAINVPRKITLRHEFAGDPLAFAKETGNAESVRALCAELTVRVDEMLESVSSAICWWAACSTGWTKKRKPGNATEAAVPIRNAAQGHFVRTTVMHRSHPPRTS
jgi:hypothetical protein